VTSLSRIKRAGRRLVRPLALQALRRTGTFDVTWRSLRKLRDRGLEVNMAVDGGAASGEWTTRLKKLYPNAQVLCIEPRDDARDHLDRLASKLPGIHVAKTTLGDREGEIDLHVHGDQSSVLRNASGSEFGDIERTTVRTLDALVKSRGLPPPDLIKLDLQGAELMCLRGSPDCLAQAQAVILEVLVLPLYKDAPLLADLIGFMTGAGFRTYDIVSLWHRPLDGALAYGDFVFVRESSPLIADGRWSSHAPWEAVREHQ
jgi:FkbM family methyltransferase